MITASAKAECIVDGVTITSGVKPSVSLFADFPEGRKKGKMLSSRSSGRFFLI